MIKAEEFERLAIIYLIGPILIVVVLGLLINIVRAF